MPKLSDGKLAIGGLIALSIWIFVVLPFLYVVPRYSQSENHPAQQASENSGISAKPKEPFWERATDDPVAIFTLALVVFTFVLAVSTIGLWIVTWLSGRRQSRDMEASIKAARDSNMLTREIFIAEQRPWLRWNINQICILKSEGQNLGITIDGTLINLGKIPATNISYFGRLYVPPPDIGAINFGQMYFVERKAELEKIGYFALASALPQETVPMRFGPHDIKISDLPDNFTLWLAFHGSYMYAAGGAASPRATGEIGTIYMVQPIGQSTLIFQKDAVAKGQIQVALREFSGSRLLT